MSRLTGRDGRDGAVAGEARFVQAFGPWALAFTLVAWAVRAFTLRRNARLVELRDAVHGRTVATETVSDVDLDTL